MEFVTTILAILIVLPALLLTLDFLHYLVTGHRLLGEDFAHFLEVVSVVCFPVLFIILFDNGTENDCCAITAVFSPAHRPSLYILLAACIFSFLHVTFRRKAAPPLPEVLVTSLLLTGFVLNGVISVHAIFPFSLIGNVPIGVAFIFALIKSQQDVMERARAGDFRTDSRWSRLAVRLLTARAYVRYPLLLLLCLPLLAVFSALLLLFGQQPDSLVRAFTDTYKQGFSQLDYQCENVQCGGHYLCSVAANGHPAVVRPRRLGKRSGAWILCNRQLLVANAFEEVVQERFPRLHRSIRRRYDRVGERVHRYYYLFENKFVSDVVYLLMKPLEWGFIVFLYTVDRRPEERIGRQYWLER